MSKGLGRVQRAILDTLSGAALDTHTLSLYAGASQESTRRALRTLRRAGRVCWLGSTGRGIGKWCLAEEAALFDVWPDELRERIQALMGRRHFSSLRRAVLATL